jgi:hypothetical protein
LFSPTSRFKRQKLAIFGRAHCFRSNCHERREEQLGKPCYPESRLDPKEGLDVQGLGDVSPGSSSRGTYPFPMRLIRQTEVFVPLWQIERAPTNSSIVMMDLNTHPSFKRMFSDVLDIEHVLLSDVIDLDFLIEFSTDADDRIEQPQPFSRQFRYIPRRCQGRRICHCSLPWTATSPTFSLRARTDCGLCQGFLWFELHMN